RTVLRRKGGAVVPRQLQRILRETPAFTMTEWIVVVAVIGIITAVGAPTLWTYFRTAALRGAAEELVTVLNGARQLAIRTNSTVCVTNDGTRVQYHLSTCNAHTRKGQGNDGSVHITTS